MQKGTIATLKNGFGFIKQEGEDGDLFFHLSKLQGVEFNDLREGDALEFEIGEGRNGKPEAININRV